MSRLCAMAIVSCLAGCGAAALPGGSGDFSLVSGVPAEWALRVDEARYLDAAECVELCPPAYRERVTSCHLARVVGTPSSPDTAAVVCNGSEAKPR